MKNIGQAAFILAFACLLTVPWALIGLWPWFWFFVSVCVILGLFEGACVFLYGKTLSQMFREYRKEEPEKAWAVFGCVVVAILLLGWHLLGG